MKTLKYTKLNCNIYINLLRSPFFQELEDKIFKYSWGVLAPPPSEYATSLVASSLLLDGTKGVSGLSKLSHYRPAISDLVHKKVS